MEKIYLVLIIFFAYLVQSITGFGGALLSLPLTILLVGFNNARVLAAALSFLTGAIVSFRHRRHINRPKLIRILTVMTIGTGIGLLLDRIIEFQFLIIAYGLITIAIAIKGFIPHKEMNKPLNKKISLLILILAGIMQGLFVAGGAFLLVYAMHELTDKLEFRATCSAVWCAQNTLMLLSYGFSGRIGVENLSLVAICAPVVLVMMFVAEIIQGKIGQGLFVKLINSLLLVTGLLLVLRS